MRATELAPNFRHVRLLLAREKGHPAGDADTGYDILVPLEPDGRIDLATWKGQRALCRVRHFAGNEDEAIGLLRHKPGGQWYFDYPDAERSDEVAFRFGEEHFVTGEYVSIGRRGAMHTFQVARVEKP